MFAVLWLAPHVTARCAAGWSAELTGVLVTHVPGSLEAGRALRRAGHLVRGRCHAEGMAGRSARGRAQGARSDRQASR